MQVELERMSRRGGGNLRRKFREFNGMVAGPILRAAWLHDFQATLPCSPLQLLQAAEFVSIEQTGTTRGQEKQAIISTRDQSIRTMKREY